MMAFPWLLILITVVSLVGQGLLQTILVLGITGGIGGSRIARRAVIGIRENMYLQAAEAFGASAPRTIFRHVLPNIMAPMIITFTVTIGGVIMAEASLSFLGFCIPPNVATWGGMLSNDGRRFMESAPCATYAGMRLQVPLARDDALDRGNVVATIRVGTTSVVVIGLEELIVDRLAAWQFWRSEIDGYNAWLLWSSGNHRPNLARLRALAERNEASAALDSLVAFARTHVAREPTHTEVETWARTNP